MLRLKEGENFIVKGLRSLPAVVVSLLPVVVVHS